MSSTGKEGHGTERRSVGMDGEVWAGNDGVWTVKKKSELGRRIMGMDGGV